MFSEIKQKEQKEKKEIINKIEHLKEEEFNDETGQ